jgi:hypothetical protein
MFSTKRKGVVILVFLVIVVVVAAIALHRYKTTYPYGMSHCCIILMNVALMNYAQDHDGKYPDGQVSPEASLSLLYRSNYIDAATLRGMTVPEETVCRILEGGGLPGPESCGWQYVPGLTLADDPGLAILWCKEALGHNGQRTKDRGRQVVFIGKGIEWVSGEKWPAFLQEQADLLKRRVQRAKSGLPLVTGSITLPDGSRTKRVEGSWGLEEDSETPDGSGRGSSSGTDLAESALVWYQAPVKNGHVTRTLTFSNLVSDPVTITFVDGKPDITNFIFRMRQRGTR